MISVECTGELQYITTFNGCKENDVSYIVATIIRSFADSGNLTPFEREQLEADLYKRCGEILGTESESYIE